MNYVSSTKPAISAAGVGCAVALAMAWSGYAPALGTENYGEILPLQQASRISFKRPTLPPLGYTEFCLRHQTDCKVQGQDSQVAPLTKERLNELNSVNRDVNRSIAPEAKSTDPAAADWQVSPPAGDCNDYAVTKRHELLARGWPSNALLLSEVVLTSGEHHLVLAVHTITGDLVLDSLDTEIRTVGSTGYHWLRAESPADPNFWSIVTVEG
jgi:predicted transglutaminase-like cysteine proteinase